MIKNKLLVLFTILSALALGACGSSSSGGGGGGGGLATGTFTKTVPLVDVANDVLPFSGSNTNRIQILYLASEINGSGYITELKMFYGGGEVTDTTCPNMTVKIGQTSLALLGTTFSTNVEEGKGTFKTVINDANFVIPAGANGNEISITLETPFHYNGVDNLVVEFTQATVCSQQVATDRATLGVVRRVFDWPIDGTPDTANATQNTANLMKFVFAGGDNSVIAADTVAGPTPSFVAPSRDGRTQYLILASDINGSGPVTGIQFLFSGALGTALTTTNKITLSHVDPGTTALVDTFATNVGTSATVVTNATTITVPVGATEWWVPLTGYFSYNGTSNLLIDVETTASINPTSLFYMNTTGDRTRTSADAADLIGFNPGASGRGLQPKLRFNGGTMDVILDPSGTSSQIFPFYNDSGSLQHLYHAAHLGSAGTITRFECRNNAIIAPAAQTGLTYTINMAHTTATDLVADFATNLQSNNTQVYNGTFDIPLTLEGDWFGVNLTTPFSYDGKSNLVVEIRGTGGTDDQFDCQRATGLPNDLLAYGGLNEAATTGALSGNLIDARFYISR